MPKHEPGGPKAIAKQLKAKGLQKLKFYCQMCEKQCRDENGFKNHCQTEGHQRQILLFANNSQKFVRDFSAEFLNGFVSILSRRYGTSRVWANKVYQEYISDKNHLHMNSTSWSTLSGFVQHLGAKGICKIDYDDERVGWYIQWIDKSPRALQQQQNADKLEKLKRDQEELDKQLITQQVEKGKQLLQQQSSSCEEKVVQELQKEQKVSFSLNKTQNKKRKIIDE